MSYADDQRPIHENLRRYLAGERLLNLVNEFSRKVVVVGHDNEYFDGLSTGSE